MYPDTCRVKCRDCSGWGLWRAGEAERCALCIAQTEPCDQHKCRMCDGSGFVCPDCRGMRRIRVPRPGKGSEDKPCPTCREGNNVNDYREANAIRDYLTREHMRPMTPEELRAHRRELNRQAKEKADAYHAEWVRMTGTLYGLQRKQDRWQERSRAIEEQYGPPIPLDELLKIPPAPGTKRVPLIRRTEQQP